MRANKQVYLSGFYFFQNDFLLFGCFKAAEHFNLDRPSGKTSHAGQIMLARQNRRRHENCRLLAAEYTLHDRTQRDFGFSEADIAAQQAIHGAFGFHILLDFLHTAQLILSFLMFECRFKFMLPAVILLEGIAALALALCIQRNQIDCQFLDCGLCLAARFLPFGTAQFVEPHASALRRIRTRTDVFGNQIQACRRNIQKIRTGERNLDKVLIRALYPHALHADKPADAMVFMYDQIARRQVCIAAHMVSIGFFAAFFFLFSGSKHLSFRQNRRFERRIFDAGRQTAV